MLNKNSRKKTQYLRRDVCIGLLLVVSFAGAERRGCLLGASRPVRLLGLALLVGRNIASQSSVEHIGGDAAAAEGEIAWEWRFRPV
jgi:hypothetical protein